MHVCVCVCERDRYPFTPMNYNGYSSPICMFDERDLLVIFSGLKE